MPRPNRRTVRVRGSGRRRDAYVGRVQLVLAVFWVCLGLVVARAAQLQIYQHAHLQHLAQEQYLNTVRVPAKRGQIYDRGGNALAISVDVPSVYANPKLLADPREAAKQLAPVLGMDVPSLRERLESDRYFVWLKRQIEPPDAERVARLGILGINITKEPRRFYPNREIGAHVVGFAGLDARGLEGVEKQLDAELLGEPQVVPAVRDARGGAVLAGGLDPTQRSRGSDVRLTLDLQLQHAAQAAVQRSLLNARARGAMALVLDVASAEVLAMAVAPAFNPNQGNKERPERRRNRVVTDVFEPGSTLKPLVVAAALNAQAIQPKTVMFCENGRYAIGRHTISDTSPHAWMGLTEILAKSSNIGMAKIAEALGRERLEASLRQMGLTKRTGIELPGEVNGMLRPSASWSDLETATISFGQGMAVNGLQLAAAYRALAADGVYKEPRLVKAVDRSDGTHLVPQSSPERRLFSAVTAKRVTAMLEASVAPGTGTGRLAAVPGYRVAGKTGTAQKADPLTGGYSRDRYLALFTGYLPAEAPRVVIVVAVDEPQGSHFGGTVAAPVFAEIGMAAMQRLGVLSSSPQAPVAAASVASASQENLAVAEERPAVVDSAPPQPGVLPSFMGLTPRQVVERLVQSGLGVDLNLAGTGRVVRQDPGGGSAPGLGRHVNLVLAP